MSKVFWVMFTIVALAIFGWWVLIGTIAVKAYHEVDNHGLKSVIERVWNGKDGSNVKPTNR